MVISVSRNIFSVYKAVKRHTSLVAAAAPATNSGVRRHWTCMTISCPATKLHLSSDATRFEASITTYRISEDATVWREWWVS